MPAKIKFKADPLRYPKQRFLIQVPYHTGLKIWFIQKESFMNESSGTSVDPGCEALLFPFSNML